MVPFGGSQLLVEAFIQLNLSCNCHPDSISCPFCYPGSVGRKLWEWEPCSIPNWSGYYKGRVYLVSEHSFATCTCVWPGKEGL